MLFCSLCTQPAVAMTHSWNIVKTVLLTEKRRLYANKIAGIVKTYFHNGKLNSFYRMESTRNAKPYITIEGQYTDGEKSGHWKQYIAINDTTHEWDECLF